jgi:hypothetical protein
MPGDQASTFRDQRAESGPRKDKRFNKKTCLLGQGTQRTVRTHGQDHSMSSRGHSSRFS